MSSVYSITIPAASGGNPGVSNWPVSGRFFHVITASASFQVAKDDGDKITVARGGGFGTVLAPLWSKLTFYNSGSTAITATVYVGEVAYSDAQTTATVLSQEDSYFHVKILHGNLTTGNSEAIPSINGVSGIHSVTVANRSGTATDICYIEIAATGDELCPVRPGETIEYVIGGTATALQVNNPNAGSVALTISAKYYY